MRRASNSATIICSFAILALAFTSSCAKKALVKKDAPDQIKAATEPEQEKEASIRGKGYQKISDLETVYFDFDKAELGPKAREILYKNAAWIKSRPDAEIKIEGHCDERGTTEYNLALGSRRATIVRDYYRSLGVSMKRISTISYGEEKPVCAESAESCWSKNRRAETYVRKEE